MRRSRGSLLARLALIALWIAILVWLPFEDRSPFFAQLLALLLCGLLGLRMFFSHWTAGPLLAAGAGLAAGLAVSPLAVGLMILKSGLHAHGVPEFSLEDIAGVLARAPVFALAGLLVGGGLHRLRGTLDAD